MQLVVYKKDGTKSGETVELPDSLLGGEPNDHAIWLAVRSEEAGHHQGTHMTRNRNKVRGGGRKPFRQKGRGMARQGTIRSPLNPGGGTIFGPRPHAYTVALNRKARRLARRSAVLYKARENAIHVVEDFSLEAPRTREVAAVFKALKLESDKVLMLTPGFDSVLSRSVRNIPYACSQKADAMSTRDLMNCTAILIQKSAVPQFVKAIDNAA